MRNPAYKQTNKQTNKQTHGGHCNIPLFAGKQSKKHKCFSNLNINEYIIKNDGSDNFKDILQSYYDKHKKKFDDFTVSVVWMNNALVVNKFSVPCIITYHQNFMELTINGKKQRVIFSINLIKII